MREEDWLRSQCLMALEEARQVVALKRSQMGLAPRDVNHIDCYNPACELGAASVVAAGVGCSQAEAVWALRDLEHRGVLILSDMGDPNSPDFITDVEFVPSAGPAWMKGAEANSKPARQRSVSQSDRRLVYERDNYSCVLCGATADLTLDHIFPFSKGGSDAAVNLRILCRSCNSSKGARLPDSIRLLGAP